MVPKKISPDEGKHMEKRQSFLETVGQKKGEKEAQRLPTHLVAALVVLALLTGIAVTITVIKPQPNVVVPGTDQNVNDTGYKTVEVTIIYSNGCKECRETTTVEELFKVRQVSYNLKKVEAGSAEGKALVEKYSIDRVPIAIIDAAKLEFYPTTENNFEGIVSEGQMRKVGSAYIMPELNLNSNYYYPVYYLEKTPGFCTGEKPTVVAFVDYYSENYTKQRRMLYDFITDFNTGTDIKFSFAQSASQDTNSVLANIFLSCASQQGKFTELEKTMTGIYCNNPFNGDPTILTNPEIDGCWSLSDHYGIPLSQMELDVSLDRSDINKSAFLACFDNQKVVYNNAKKAAEDLGIIRGGTYLIDCRETTSLPHLRESFCAIHPEIGACKSSAADMGSQ